ncbi:class I SAM-dependent methyltransferase [Dysgonomonas sp. Marseille-P4677]|uniref:class I SAM-dependent methyltransferase n=1 Tax=Dysgonomonas sp. Marseille-P4677 TaxID=2364790 RepID=UPI00191125DF|nr:class I SAM-dependent methyltransferase [Dysgonomonas sp. Marseille-P4677]MBK5719702.1 class I SAM-dependent methyltransferase [Dysgonomonas sp. Marseille-P4677]
MPRIYKLSKAGLKLLYKIRHHRGHGIHSPFVFNLVTKVIEEKTPYHAYEDISFVLNKSQRHFKLDKYSRLYFRLANYFEVRQVLEIGSGSGVDTLCLTAPSASINCICVEPSEEKRAQAQKLYNNWDRNIKLYTDKDLPDLSEKVDCILLNLSSYTSFSFDISEYLLNISHEKTFIIVKGIRTNKHHQTLWKSIINIESRTAVLDLFNVGILFFDKQLYKWNYQISF